MQPKPSVEVDGAILFSRGGHGDAWTRFVVALLKERDDHVQAIGCSALKDRHKDFASLVFLSRGPNNPWGKRRIACYSVHCHQRSSKKGASGCHRCHGLPPLEIR